MLSLRLDVKAGTERLTSDFHSPSVLLGEDIRTRFADVPDLIAHCYTHTCLSRFGNLPKSFSAAKTILARLCHMSGQMEVTWLRR